MKVKYGHHDNVAPNIYRFFFIPPHKLHYTAGQFIELEVPHPNPDERGIRHWFTLSSSPTEDEVFITTKFTPERSSTFKQALKSLKKGTELLMVEPDGDFVLPDDPARPLVFVAGGIGITPFRSMVKYLTDTAEKRTVQLIYAVNQADQAVYLDLFKDYGADVRLIVKNPPADWQGDNGSLDTERILKLIGGLDHKLIYISGPEPMVESFQKGLQAKGVPDNQLRTDFFPNYSDI